MISRTGIHALRAMAVLGSLPVDRYVGAAQIASRIKAPANYLGKLLQKLARAGVVVGRKGSQGGFRLARSPGDITLLEVLEPVEHVMSERGCVLGKASCVHREPCSLHKKWSAVREEYFSFLRTTTLDEVAV